MPLSWTTAGYNAQSETASAAGMLRALVHDETVPLERTGAVVQTVYEFSGIALLEHLLGALAHGSGRKTWNWVAGLGDTELTKTTRYVMEGDLVGVIAFCELGYGTDADGLALDPHTAFAELAPDYPAFAGESFDLPREIARFAWPTAVLSGRRDLRTPRVIAEQTVEAIPDAVLVPFPELGHSVLDNHPVAALHVAHAVASQAHHRLPGLVPRLAALPQRGSQRMVGPMIAARLAAERTLRR